MNPNESTTFNRSSVIQQKNHFVKIDFKKESYLLFLCFTYFVQNVLRNRFQFCFPEWLIVLNLISKK